MVLAFPVLAGQQDDPAKDKADQHGLGQVGVENVPPYRQRGKKRRQQGIVKPRNALSADVAGEKKGQPQRQMGDNRTKGKPKDKRRGARQSRGDPMAEPKGKDKDA